MLDYILQAVGLRRPAKKKPASSWTNNRVFNLFKAAPKKAEKKPVTSRWNPFASAAKSPKPLRPPTSTSTGHDPVKQLIDSLPDPPTRKSGWSFSPFRTKTKNALTDSLQQLPPAQLYDLYRKGYIPAHAMQEMLYPAKHRLSAGGGATYFTAVNMALVAVAYYFAAKYGWTDKLGSVVASGWSFVSPYVMWLPRLAYEFMDFATSGIWTVAIRHVGYIANWIKTESNYWYHRVVDGLPADLARNKIEQKKNKKKIKDRYMGEGVNGMVDSKAAATGLAADLKAVGYIPPRDLVSMIQFIRTKEPVDDRKLDGAHIIALLTKLPGTSALRHKLTNGLVVNFYEKLLHPPLSSLGLDHRFRTADGGNNNFLFPDLGRAGTPYSKSVNGKVKQLGAKPDPGVLFDLLMSREDGKFEEHAAGLSSIFFYHAAIIIHDVFRTNRSDSNISDASSYLDLAPLYGSSEEELASVRTFENGMLKPDAFSEKRLLGQPPGVSVLLVFYNRFHNYVAKYLAEINEGGRFSLGPKGDAAAKKLRDNELFQTARLITGGLYIEITLNDYLRAIFNLHRTNTDWVMDPRVEIEGHPRGLGNQVSCEFNLCYRFHCTLSQRDEKWVNEFFMSLAADKTKALSDWSLPDLLSALGKFEKSTDPDPGKREFGGMKRGPDGKFADADLVNMFNESMKDPAGAFTKRHVPKALRVVEILGILQARRWQVASLNEFRQFFGLKAFETFEDMNPDPEVANTLRNLYTHPDLVELYPGIMLEEAKDRLDPGIGLCEPYTLSIAILSDAITLIRSDRFLTLDYTATHLTNWGMHEIAPDPNILGGSVFYKLVQAAVPGWFPYNCVATMQPMYTKAANISIATELGTIGQYSTEEPAPPSVLHRVSNYKDVTAMLENDKSFVRPFSLRWIDLFPEKKKEDVNCRLMLLGESAEHIRQRNDVGDALYKPEARAVYSDLLYKMGKKMLVEESFQLREEHLQIDILRDVLIPMTTQFLAELFCIDIKTEERPDGKFTTTELYAMFIELREWVFFNDATLLWPRRARAMEARRTLQQSCEKEVLRISASATGLLPASVPATGNLENYCPYLRSKKAGPTSVTGYEDLRALGETMVRSLLEGGRSVDEVAELNFMFCMAGSGNLAVTFASVLGFFLSEQGNSHWPAIQKLAAEDTPEALSQLRRYVMEAQRVHDTAFTLRSVTEDTTVSGKEYKKGERIIFDLNKAASDEAGFPEPEKFKLDRPLANYLRFSWGPHTCLGGDLSLQAMVAMIKVCAQLKNLRPAPGDMGVVKVIVVDRRPFYMTEDWASHTNDPTNWKLHYDGFGIGTASGVDVDHTVSVTQPPLVHNDVDSNLPNGQQQQQPGNQSPPSTTGKPGGNTQGQSNGNPYGTDDLTNGVPNGEGGGVPAKKPDAPIGTDGSKPDGDAAKAAAAAAAAKAKEEAEKIKAEAEANAIAAAKAKAQADVDAANAKAAADKAKAEAEAKAKEAEKAKAEAEAKAKEAAEKAKAEAEAKAKAEAESKAKAEAEAKAKAQAEAEAKAQAKAEAEVKAKAAETAATQAKEVAEKARAEADTKAEAVDAAKAAEAQAESQLTTKGIQSGLAATSSDGSKGFTVQLSFPNAYKDKEPVVVFGISNLAMSLNRTYPAKATVVPTAITKTSVNTVAIPPDASGLWCTFSWLALPSASSSSSSTTNWFVTGTYNGVPVTPASQASYSTTPVRYSFPRAFNQGADLCVCLWLNSFSFGTGYDTRAEIYSYGVNNTGMSVYALTLGKNVDPASTVGISYFVHPRNAPGFTSGTFKIGDHSSPLPPGTDGYVAFPNTAAPFKSPPRVFLAVSGFASSSARSLALEVSTNSITAQGFSWHHRTYPDSEMYFLECSWIAVEDCSVAEAELAKKTSEAETGAADAKRKAEEAEKAAAEAAAAATKAQAVAAGN